MKSENENFDLSEYAKSKEFKRFMKYKKIGIPKKLLENIKEKEKEILILKEVLKIFNNPKLGIDFELGSECYSMFSSEDYDYNDVFEFLSRYSKNQNKQRSKLLEY